MLLCAALVLQIKAKKKIFGWYLMRNLSENVLDGTTFLLTTPTDFFILGILLYLQKTLYLQLFKNNSPF